MGVPLLGSGWHALGEERGAWAPRKKVIVFLSIIHRDKDVITLAAIILKKFCDKKIQLFLSLKPPGREEPRGKSPWASSSCPRLRSPYGFAVALTKDLYAPNCARSSSFNGLKEFDRSDRSRKRKQERTMGGVPRTICEASTSSGAGARARLLRRRSFLLEPRPSSSRRRRERER